MRIDIAELFNIFGESPPSHQFVEPMEMPEPYHRLLVHHNHMTVTVEAHHGGPVNVRVLKRHQDTHSYARMIMLDRWDGQPVQFGLVRIDLNCCPIDVRSEILAENTPLGRILINHNLLRRIEPTAFFKVNPPLDWFGRAGTTYGRLGIIHVNSKPAVELVEILAPEPS